MLELQHILHVRVSILNSSPQLKIAVSASVDIQREILVTVMEQSACNQWQMLPWINLHYEVILFLSLTCGLQNKLDFFKFVLFCQFESFLRLYQGVVMDMNENISKVDMKSEVLHGPFARFSSSRSPSSRRRWWVNRPDSWSLRRCSRWPVPLISGRSTQQARMGQWRRSLAAQVEMAHTAVLRVIILLPSTRFSCPTQIFPK